MHVVIVRAGVSEAGRSGSNLEQGSASEMLRKASRFRSMVSWAALLLHVQQSGTRNPEVIIWSPNAEHS